MLNSAKWIWVDQAQEKDTYGEFYSTFQYRKGKIKLALSVDSNYAVFVNGVFVNSGQYPDYPHYKVYDKLDVTEYCRQGENHIAIIVWYYGVSGTLTYYQGNAGLCFAVYTDDKLCITSDEEVMSRLSITYQNGLKKFITWQQGYSFHYDASVADGWMLGELVGFRKSRVVEQELSLHERPIEKVVIGERAESKLLKKEQKYFLYDLGKEEVGYLTLSVRSETKQKLTIIFGEHIKDGIVRRKIGATDFSIEVTVGEGITEYTNYFRRLGCRYLEIWSEDDLAIDYFSLKPCFYPLKKVKMKFEDSQWQKIYDTSVRTLELCMHDHYEDCPWREQAFYAMDSRNQMLCGYYAFEEYRFARECLYLMSHGIREDGLLSMCAPSDKDLTIPSFVLHYFTSVYEYTKCSRDKTLAKELLPTLQKIMKVFTDRVKDGLVPIFEEPIYWNFYEWTDDMANDDCLNTPDLEVALNCLVSIALQNLQKMCDMLEVKADYQDIVEQLNKKIHATFYCGDTGLCVNRQGEERYSELGNALAVLCGAVTEKEAEYICEQFVHGEQMTKISLSMMCFKYDALLKVNKEKYKPFILEDLKTTYQMMLDAGATSFWETLLGEADFYNAGSLCHGWSAMPVYYLNIL